MATKTLKDIFDILIAELTTNIALTSWCQTNYGVQPVIRFGIDENDIPEAPDTLEIHLIPGARSRTRQFAYRSYGLDIHAVINKTSVREPALTNAYVLESIESLDQFISLIEEAVIPVLNRNSIIVTPTEGDEDAVGYPYAVGCLSYVLEVPSRLL